MGGVATIRSRYNRHSSKSSICTEAPDPAHCITKGRNFGGKIFFDCKSERECAQAKLIHHPPQRRISPPRVPFNWSATPLMQAIWKKVEQKNALIGDLKSSQGVDGTGHYTYSLRGSMLWPAMRDLRASQRTRFGCWTCCLWPPCVSKSLLLRRPRCPWLDWRHGPSRH